MSWVRHEFKCPNCDSNVILNYVETYPLLSIETICDHCYFPLAFDPIKKEIKIRRKPIQKRAFLIHSAKKEDESLLKWFRGIVDLYGVSTHIIEEDRRSQPDWLQKSIDGIRSTEFVLVLLTKRYQYRDESGLLRWKGPDKCYDEIAMSFALGTVLGGRDIFALVEKDVDPGRVLEARAWYYTLEREYQKFGIDIEFFLKLDEYTGI